jgi:nucleoside-diphosphate-sugar epimerase
MNQASQSVALLDLIEFLEDALGSSVRPEFISSRVGDVLHSYAAVSAARAILGYVPSVDFPVGRWLTVQSMGGKEPRTIAERRTPSPVS